MAPIKNTTLPHHLPNAKPVSRTGRCPKKSDAKKRTGLFILVGKQFQTHVRICRLVYVSFGSHAVQYCLPLLPSLWFVPADHGQQVAGASATPWSPGPSAEGLMFCQPTGAWSLWKTQQNMVELFLALHLPVTAKNKYNTRGRRIQKTG